MNKAQTKKVLMLVFLVFSFMFLMFGGLLGFVGELKAETNEVATGGNEAVFEYEQISQTQKLGDIFIVPQATATLNGTKKEAAHILIFPDGSYVTASSAKLNSQGDYRLVFACNFDGNVYTETVDFSVFASGTDLFSADGAKINFVQGETYSGVRVVSPRTEIVTKYQRVVDLSDNTADDKLLEILANPGVFGEADFAELKITFTDKYDEGNYFFIVIDTNPFNANTLSTVRAGTTTQPEKGLNGATLEMRKLQGTRINASFKTGNEPMCFYFDYEGMKLYAANPVSGGTRAMIIDFHDSSYYAETTFWKGLTTGEAVVTIETSNLVKGFADYTILSIDGQDFSEEEIKDTSSPVIKIDTLNFAHDNLPFAVEGEKYPVFEATAYDSFEMADKNVIVEVYGDYGRVTQEQLSIDSGFFTAEKSSAGSSFESYTLLYTAEDNAGNIAEEMLEIEIMQGDTSLKIEFAEEIPGTMFAGQRLGLAKYSLSGGSGETTAELSYRFGEEEAVEIENGEFIPSKAGSYTLIATLTDFLGRKNVITYPVEVTAPVKPEFEMPVLPQAILNGSEYTFPAFEPVWYNAETGIAEKAHGFIEVVYNGMPEVLDADRKYTPHANNTGDVLTVNYIARIPGERTETVKSFEVTVIEPFQQGLLKMDRLFLKEGIESAVSDSSGITFKTRENGAKLTFVNPIVASNVNFELSVPANANNFASFTITVKDSENSDISVELTVFKGAPNQQTSEFSVNNGIKTDISSNFFGSTVNNFGLKYDMTTLSIIDNNTAAAVAKIETCKNGEVFEGFPSGKVFFDITFNGVEDVSAIKVINVGNQKINDIELDFISPSMFITQEINPNANLGETVIIPAAVAADIVAGNNVEAKVTVTAPDKTVIYRDEDITEPLTLKVEQFGEYNITYIVSDPAGNSSRRSYVFNVKNDVIPELKIDGKVSSSAKLGKAVTLPGATVTNMDAGQVKIYIFYISPNDEMRLITDNKFIPEMEGEYTIRYYAVDDFFNSTTVDFTVRVS